ncbi:zinc finger-like domain-containing protein [Pseudomonas monteilii]|uniref:zinc finger-like domain-containing protein n=1 Tax=Pseudomonas monteilii TaxID=76759 RepID=UPI000A6B4C49|nr:zinc finger-like domain-containing protein [Pseudomonas monteilii]
MRSREQDRQQWQDPDFNKWLDEAISDAGHIVWDAIPDVGSAWNGWDAAKAALGYYCPACNGSGEEIHVTYHGPDSFERLGHCTACNGDGRTSAALAVASERLVSETAHRGDLQAKVCGLQAEIDKLKTDNEAWGLTVEAERRIKRGISDENEALRMQVKELDLLFGRYLLGMRAAVVEWQKGKGADAAMQWIWNGLRGPGELPPEEETQAQAYFDREVVKIEEGLEEVYAYRDKRRSEKAQGGI